MERGRRPGDTAGQDRAVSRALKSRLTSLERQHPLPSTDPHEMIDGERWRVIAESVHTLLQSHVWPDGLVDLLQRMGADTMTEEDRQLGGRVAETLIHTDMTAGEMLRLVFNLDASV